MEKTMSVGLRAWIAAAILLSAGFTGFARAADAPPAPPAPTAMPAPPKPPLFVAIYERGSAWDDSKAALAQTGINDHMQYLRSNIDKLVAAAPFMEGLAAGSSDRMVGLVIVTAASPEEAQKLIADDPAVSVKLMKATVRRWMADRVKAFPQ
jgi:hypothetical protein